MTESIRKIIVVVGCQRSGTTLTGQILGAHPDAVLLDEPDGVYRWFYAAVGKEPTAGEHYESMLRRAARKYHSASKRFVESAGRMELIPRVTTLVLKAPNLTYEYKMLGNFRLPVSVVYPVRDPRSVVASMMRLYHQNNDIAGRQVSLISKRHGEVYRLKREMLPCENEPLWVKCATVWKIKSGLANEFRQSGLDVFQFRYEDLVQRQEKVGELVGHCGLEIGDDTLNTQTAYVGKGPGGTDRTRPVDESSLDNWKRFLDEEKEDDVLRICYPLAEYFGYIKSMKPNA